MFNRTGVTRYDFTKHQCIIPLPKSWCAWFRDSVSALRDDLQGKRLQLQPWKCHSWWSTTYSLLLAATGIPQAIQAVRWPAILHSGRQDRGGNHPKRLFSQSTARPESIVAGCSQSSRQNLNRVLFVRAGEERGVESYKIRRSDLYRVALFDWIPAWVTLLDWIPAWR